MTVSHQTSPKRDMRFEVVHEQVRRTAKPGEILSLSASLLFLIRLCMSPISFRLESDEDAGQVRRTELKVRGDNGAVERLAPQTATLFIKGTDKYHGYQGIYRVAQDVRDLVEGLRSRHSTWVVGCTPVDQFRKCDRGVRERGIGNANANATR